MSFTRRSLLRGLSFAPIASAALSVRCGGVEPLSGDPMINPMIDREDPQTRRVVGEYAGDPATYGDVEPVTRNPEDCVPTGADILGPMHREGAPARMVLAGENEPGERLTIEGTVYASDCRRPVRGAWLDVWQADATGTYDRFSAEFHLRGQLMTDNEGRFRIETIRPGSYDARPAHIHFIVTHPSHAPLTTQLYFRGDPLLSNDSCGGCNSDDPTLIIDLADAPGGKKLGRFDIVLRDA
jgi:catechol 1,2-dioxygenase